MEFQICFQSSVKRPPTNLHCQRMSTGWALWTLLHTCLNTIDILRRSDFAAFLLEHDWHSQALGLRCIPAWTRLTFSGVRTSLYSCLNTIDILRRSDRCNPAWTRLTFSGVRVVLGLPVDFLLSTLPYSLQDWTHRAIVRLSGTRWWRCPWRKKRWTAITLIERIKYLWLCMMDAIL